MQTSAPPQHATNDTGKVRILLQTFTHLVPGSDRGEKLTVIENLISRHHWNRDFDSDQERKFLYHADFGLDNIECFILIDHHGHDHGSIQEQNVPVLWYKWKDQSLVQIKQELPSKIQKELRKWPFTWEGRKFNRVPKGPDGKYTTIDRRQSVADGLRLGIPVLEEDREFLREYPEHAQWLKNHLVHKLWMKIEPFCELPNGENG